MNPRAVRVEMAKNRILLSSSVPTPGLSQALPGAYFRQDKVWSLPLDLSTCRLLRERFGDRLLIGPALTAWAKAEKEHSNRQAAIAAAEDAPLQHLHLAAPRLYAAMGSRPYQKAAVRFVVDAEGRDGRKRALVADTVGLGKTAEALGAVLENDVPGPYVVVAPKTAANNVWKPEIHRWLDDAEVITFPDGKAARENIVNSLAVRNGIEPGEFGSLAKTWIILHPAMVRTQTWWVCRNCGERTKFKAGPAELDCLHDDGHSTIDEHAFPQLFQLNYGAVIADESDQILIRLKGTPNLQRRGMEMLRDLVVEGGMRIAMSGTPFRSKPHQAWSTLNWLDPKRWGGKWRWIQTYWKTGGYSGYEIVKDGFMEDREGIMLDDLKDVMIRRTREEVRGDLPAKIYPSNVPDNHDLEPGIYLPMSAAQAKAYKSIADNGFARIEGGEVSPLGVLAEMTRMKQFASAEGSIGADGEFMPLAKGNKFEWIVEKLKEMGLPDRPDTKLVIASQFTKLLNAFAEGVRKELKGVRIGMVTGENARTRDADISEFEDVNSDLHVLFINTKAGGSAITLDAADLMVVLDETFVDDEQQQLEGRIDNRNPERKITPRSYYYLRSIGTVEETIAAANAWARETTGKILDGNRAAAMAAHMRDTASWQKSVRSKATEQTGKAPRGRKRYPRP